MSVEETKRWKCNVCNAFVHSPTLPSTWAPMKMNDTHVCKDCVQGIMNHFGLKFKEYEDDGLGGPG